MGLTTVSFCCIHTCTQNPQCDLQAQDRCHRIGQTKPVMVYRLVTANTIDQRVVEIAASKRRLEKMVIHKGECFSLSCSLKKMTDCVGNCEGPRTPPAAIEKSKGERKGKENILEKYLMMTLYRMWPYLGKSVVISCYNNIHVNVFDGSNHNSGCRIYKHS